MDDTAQAQIEKIAEYLAVATSLTKSSPFSDYRRANELSWELAMCLPVDVYCEIAAGLLHSSKEHNYLTALIKAREYFFESPSLLTPDDIVQHAPGIGKRKDKGVC